MNFVRIYVSLKIPDNIARTALYTLRTRMGYETLRRLDRAEFWEIGFEDLESERIREIVERWVYKTAYFMNPNKHRVQIDAPERNPQENARIQAREDADGSILVCDRIDGKAESTLKALTAMCRRNESPAMLRRGMWWDVCFEGLEKDAVHDAVRRMASTTSREEGLFANPHYQDVQIFFANP